MDDILQVGDQDGTGAKIVVECGFVPRIVRVRNIESADLYDFSIHDAYRLEDDPTSVNLGKWVVRTDITVTYGILTTATTGVRSLEATSTDGITINNGTLAPFSLTGTIACTKDSNIIAGTNTLFDTELKEGDIINVGGQHLTIQEITSATAATVRDAAQKTVATVASLRLTGRAAGFNIGVDAAINVDGEWLQWEAFR